MMMNRPQQVLAAWSLIVKSKVRPKVAPKDWVMLLEVADFRGYLYYGYEGDKLANVAIAFRVKEISKNLNNILPERDDGPILFVPIYISFSHSKNQLNENISRFFNANKDIERIVFQKNNDALVTIDKERFYGRKKENRSSNTRNANV